MPRPRNLLYIVCLFAAVSVALGASAEDAFLGRWDLTVTSGSTQYPSWLEVTREGGKVAGRFVGRSGSVHPVEVEVAGDEIRFASSYRGRLVGGKLEGAATDAQGNTLRWTGVRVLRPVTPPGEPRWGKPVVLFNGRDLDGWDFRNQRGRDCWSVQESVLVNTPPCPNIFSSRKFRDFKLHIEYNLEPRSNSGVYLRGRYEVQIADQGSRELDSHGVGGIYGFIAPRLKAAKAAGEWQTFDVTLIGYRVTVVFNDKTIIENQEIDGITGGALDSDETGPGPIMLQGDHGRVRFRNIGVTPAE